MFVAEHGTENGAEAGAQRYCTYPLIGAVVAAGLLGAVAPTALANVGEIIFTAGEVRGIDASGRERPLRKGSVLENGDTVLTGGGRAQIAFSDGAMTSLQPDTEFRIDEFSYRGEGDPDSRGFFSLLRGGLRTITGAVGKLRKKSYRLTTPVATIGIRGTEYLAKLGNSLEIHVGGGGIDVCNDAGCAGFDSQETGYVPDSGSLPFSVSQPPTLAPPQESRNFNNSGNQSSSSAGDTYSSNDDRNDDGDQLVVFGEDASPLADGPLYTLAVVYDDDATGPGLLRFGDFDDGLANVSFDGTGAVSYSGEIPDVGNVSASRGTASSVDFGGDDVVGWARWTGGSANLPVPGSGSVPVNFTGSEAQHAVVGLPTADMPMTGVGTYSLLGGTSPTNRALGVGTLLSASLTANFSSQVVDLTLQYGLAGDTFNTQISSGAIDGFTFSGSAATTSSNYCMSDCYTTVEGFFAGSGASRAGIAYKTSGGLLNEKTIGTAAFTQDSLSTESDMSVGENR